MSTTRINTFHAKDGMANNLREFLISIIPIIEQSQGCESCRLLQGQDDANEFVVIEVWASVAAHQASVKNIPPENWCCNAHASEPTKWLILRSVRLHPCRPNWLAPFGR